MREAFRAMGVGIAEFPVNEETARAAAESGDFIVFGTVGPLSSRLEVNMPSYYKYSGSFTPQGLIGGVLPRSGVSARIGFHPHANSPVDLSCDSVDDSSERCETIAEDKNGSPYS